MDERVVAIRKQRPVRIISGVLSKLLSIGSLLAGGAITVAGGLHIGFHWALSYHPFAFLLGVYGVIALQLAGPEDLTIDRAARTYVLRQGMLYLAETQTGSLADIVNFHVATGTPNGVPPNLVVQKAYLAVKWRNRRKMTVIGEFYDLDEAYAQARLFQDELALNLPIVSPDNRPR